MDERGCDGANKIKALEKINSTEKHPMLWVDPFSDKDLVWDFAVWLRALCGVNAFQSVFILPIRLNCFFTLIYWPWP